MGSQYRCTKCRSVKDRDQFYWRKDRNQLRQPCKSCIAAYAAARKAADPERVREIHARSYRKNRDATFTRRRDRWLRKNFGMSLEDYEELLAVQGGRCAICRSEETVTDPRRGTVRALAVDHCHRTGRTRGLLCARCNMAIGMLGDDPVVLRSAGDYLVGFSLLHDAADHLEREGIADVRATPEAFRPEASEE